MRHLCIATLMLLHFAVPALAGGSFRGLGVVDPARYQSEALGVAADGTAVGYSGTSGFQTPVSCAPLGSLSVLPVPAGHLGGIATAVSPDGIIVGWSSFGGLNPVIWIGGSVTELSTLGGPSGGTPTGVGIGGGVVVGDRFRWVAATANHDVLQCPSGWGCNATGVAGDGLRTTGTASIGSFRQALLWRDRDVIPEILPTLSASTICLANGISSDGRYVVGACVNADNRREAVRWDLATGTVLGLTNWDGIAGWDTGATYATDCSADGSVVVGWGNPTQGPDFGTAPFVWTQASGMLKLDDHLASLGVSTSGWTLLEATSVSDDGTVVAGFGFNTNVNGNPLREGFIATIDVPTGIGEQTSRPRTSWVQASPNPFNPTTTIHYAIPEDGMVELTIVDVSGRHVRTLLQGIRAAGRHRVIWRGDDQHGRLLASGAYFAHLKHPRGAMVDKLILVR